MEIIHLAHTGRLKEPPGQRDTPNPWSARYTQSLVREIHPIPRITYGQHSPVSPFPHTNLGWIIFLKTRHAAFENLKIGTLKSRMKSRSVFNFTSLTSKLQYGIYRSVQFLLPHRTRSLLRGHFHSSIGTCGCFRNITGK